MWFEKKLVLRIFLQDNWLQLVCSTAALLFIVGAVLYWRGQEQSDVSKQEEAYQAAFKWAAMLSFRQADTNCQKPQSSAAQEATCIVSDRLENGLIRRFQLACSTTIQNNGGCRLIKRLP
jgi:hypothetical protein